MSATDGLRMQDAAWAPQDGPQSDLCLCPCGEIFFGGARGGGKTTGVIGKWALKERRYGRYFNAIMFRPTTVSAEDAIEQSKEIYSPLGGEFNEQKKRWRMPNGGRVSFAYLESVQDAQEYQGRNVTDVCIEEGGLYPTPAPIDRLFGVLRSAYGVPTQLIITANPGGPGQHWIRERYRIHPFPRRPLVFARGGHNVAVIPSRISDNKILLTKDPGYIDRLKLVGSPELVRAWLEGDWSAVEGAFFAEWSEDKHVVAPFSIPDTWLRFRSADWGSYAPFSIGWWAVVTDDYALADVGAWASSGRLGSDLLARSREESTYAEPHELDEGRGGKDITLQPTANHLLPRGAIVRYREWYGKVGGKLTAEQVGDGIVEREKGDKQRLTYGVLDPSAFAEAGGPSIAERINKVLITAKLAPFRQADNRRVARNIGDPQKAGPMGGWDQVRSRLNGVDGRPMLYVFSTCRDLIRTLPVAQHDPVRAEDLDCWVAGTMISTPQGGRPIEEVRAGDVVDTPVGPRRVLRSYLAGAGETYWVRLSNEMKLQGTAHHKIYVRGKGLVRLDTVECHDILTERSISWQKRLLSIAAWCTRAMRVAGTTIRMALSWSAEAPAFIARCGLMPDGRFLPGGTFTTSMKIWTTTNSAISCVSLPETTAGFTSESVLRVNSGRNWLDGARAIRGRKRFKITPARCEAEHRDANRRAEIVDVLLLRDTLESFIAPLLAARQLVTDNLKRFARSVAKSFGLNTTARKRYEPVRIVAVGRCADAMQVYDLTVCDAHLFYANGILSSNTNAEDHALDDLRYAAMSRPWIKVLPKPERVKDGYQPAAQERDDTDSILLL